MEAVGGRGGAPPPGGPGGGEMEEGMQGWREGGGGREGRRLPVVLLGLERRPLAEELEPRRQQRAPALVARVEEEAAHRPLCAENTAGGGGGRVRGMAGGGAAVAIPEALAVMCEEFLAGGDAAEGEDEDDGHAVDRHLEIGDVVARLVWAAVVDEGHLISESLGVHKELGGVDHAQSKGVLWCVLRRSAVWVVRIRLMQQLHLQLSNILPQDRSFRNFICSKTSVLFCCSQNLVVECHMVRFNFLNLNELMYLP